MYIIRMLLVPVVCVTLAVKMVTPHLLIRVLYRWEPPYWNKTGGVAVST